MHRAATAWTLLAAAGMIGCASTTPDSSTGGGPLPMRAHINAKLPQPDSGDDNLFQGAVRFDVADDLIDYRTRYTVIPGNFLRSLSSDGKAPQSPPTQLVAHNFQHQLRTVLPTPLKAPLRLGFERRQQSLLSFHGKRDSGASNAHLEWAPKPVRLNVRWTPPSENAGSLDCTVQSNLRIPGETLKTGSDTALEISQRQCRTPALGRGTGGIHLRGRTAAWRWGDGLNSAIRIQRVEPVRYDLPSPESAPGYELGLTHRHLFGGWRAQAEIARRRTGEYASENDSGAGKHWAANILLRREFHALAITARWTHLNDPLWFLPAAPPAGGQRWSLGLDFKPWLAATLPGLDTSMTASWRQTRTAEGGGHHLSWNFSVLW